MLGGDKVSCSNNKNICYNCEYARRACILNKVACGFVFSEHKMDYQKTMEDLNLDSVNVGWGYMKRAIDDEEGKGFGAGIMTNDVVIFDKDFSCKYFIVKE